MFKAHIRCIYDFVFSLVNVDHLRLVKNDTHYKKCSGRIMY